MLSAFEAMIDVGGVPVGKGRILETPIRKWREGGGGGIDDWDRWGRTAVHWCVMNERTHQDAQERRG